MRTSAASDSAASFLISYTSCSILLIVYLGTLLPAANTQTKEHPDMTTASQPQNGQHSRTHAKAKIRVQKSEATLHDQTAGPALTEIPISETFSGDIEGQSTVRALQSQGGDKSASQVSMQRFSGELGAPRQR
jgi:hypothetical protein